MKDFKAIPDERTIEDAAKIEVLDVNGQSVQFGSVFQDQKAIVVFIRHFFCGKCQLYVENLAAIPQAALDQAGVKIVVVGCGDYQPIASYAETTRFTGPFFADPTRKLYHALGMDSETLQVTPANEQKRSYLTMGAFSNIAMSLWRGPIKHPSLVGKNGNISQNGGEFIFGPGNTCSFASRMQHTEDHIEVADLVKEAGIVLTSA
ncbi:hypothetical protein GALMADRAFT_54116 [Galerina marginata CBS 339.88]|uniref:Thioredoxin domain-containing protein n=1 Tax=Galerina marginata (strain CBS 339.88) TaxID=685588 RepID=A0A067U3U7_GALM3|nr:hypothetical protein GALMADRAFT_54116 [Galerina marginata CBS 339.88]